MITEINGQQYVLVNNENVSLPKYGTRPLPEYVYLSLGTPYNDHHRKLYINPKVSVFRALYKHLQPLEQVVKDRYLYLQRRLNQLMMVSVILILVAGWPYLTIDQLVLSVIAAMFISGMLTVGLCDRQAAEQKQIKDYADNLYGLLFRHIQDTSNAYLETVKEHNDMCDEHIATLKDEMENQNKNFYELVEHSHGYLDLAKHYLKERDQVQAQLNTVVVLYQDLMDRTSEEELNDYKSYWEDKGIQFLPSPVHIKTKQ